MEELSIGAAARLVITSHALRRHARRAQRELAELGVHQNLAASQEFFARALGFANWNEAQQVAAGDMASSPEKKADASQKIAELIAVSAENSSPSQKRPAPPTAAFWEDESASLDGPAFERILLRVAQAGLRDFFVLAWDRMSVEKNGRFQTFSSRKLSFGEVLECAAALRGESAEELKKTMMEGVALDFSTTIKGPDNSGFRVRAKLNRTFTVETGERIALSVHLFPEAPPKLSDLIPEEGRRAALAGQKSGLILVAGAAGTGKSTLLASIIRDRSEKPGGNGGRILTYERPIEFSYGDAGNQNCVIEQTDVGKTASAFADGVRGGMRQKPSMIMVSEARDKQTFDACVDAVESGAVVCAGVGLDSAAKALRGLRGLFSDLDQAGEWPRLLRSLKVIVAHWAVRGVDGNRLILKEFLEIDDGLIQELQLLDNLDLIEDVAKKALDARKSSFAHEAKKKHALGQLSDKALKRVVESNC